MTFQKAQLKNIAGVINFSGSISPNTESLILKILLNDTTIEKSDILPVAKYLIKRNLVTVPWLIKRFQLTFNELDEAFGGHFLNHSFNNILKCEQDEFMQLLQIDCDEVFKKYAIDDNSYIMRKICQLLKIEKSNILGDRGLLIPIAQNGQLSILKELHEIFEFTKDNIGNLAAIRAAEKGHLNVLKWLVSKFSLERKELIGIHTNILQKVAQNGHLDVLKWLVEKFQLSTLNVVSISNYDIVLVAAVNGHIQILEYLAEKFTLEKRGISGDSFYTFRRVAGEGQLEALKWMVKQFKIEKIDVLLEIDLTFRWLVVGGHLEVLQWITEEFALVQTDFKDFNDILQKSAKNNQLEIFQYVDKKYGVKTERIKHWGNFILQLAAEYGNLELLMWLISRYNLTREDVTCDDNYAFRYAAKKGKLHILEWLHKTYQITKSEATTSNNFAYREALHNGNFNTVTWLAKEFKITPWDDCNKIQEMATLTWSFFKDRPANHRREILAKIVRSNSYFPPGKIREYIKQLSDDKVIFYCCEDSRLFERIIEIYELEGKTREEIAEKLENCCTDEHIKKFVSHLCDDDDDEMPELEPEPEPAKSVDEIKKMLPGYIIMTPEELAQHISNKLTGVN